MNRIVIVILLVALSSSISFAQDLNARVDVLIAKCMHLLNTQQYNAAYDSCQVLLLIENARRKLTAIKSTRTLAKTYAIKAECLKGLGEYDKACHSYETADSLAPYYDRDNYRFGYANLLVLVGAYQKAIEIVTLVEDEELLARKLITLSHAYFRRGAGGDIELATKYLDQCLAIKNIPKEDYIVATQNRGYIYWQLKQYTAAFDDISLSLEGMVTDDDNYYVTLGNLALVEADLGKYTAALQHIDKAIDWLSLNKGTAHPDYIISLRKRAEILLKQKRTQEAADAFKQYYKSERNYIITAFPKFSAQTRLDFWYSHKPLISEIFQIKDVDATFLYDVALFRRQMTLLGNNVKNMRNEINVSVDKLRKLLKPNEFAVEFTCYYDETAADSIYCALLTGNETPSRYIHIATKQQLHGHQLHNGITLEKAVCSAFTDDKNAIYEDPSLAQMIWSPIINALPSSVKCLYFAPDGILQMLGIENLSVEALQGKELHRLTSTSNLISPQNTNSLLRSLVIGGVDYNSLDADISKVDGENNHEAYNYLKDECGLNINKGTFPYLQGSSEEVNSVTNTLGNTWKISNNHSDEAFVKRNIDNFDIVHLATHGYSMRVGIGPLPLSVRDSIMKDNTLLASGIALAGANIAGVNGYAEDGLLSAREMCDLNLSRVSLVVLSACQTAQGIVSDEGPAGIVRGLKKAGVHTIIATLWPVNDAATKLFMTSFYEAWCKKRMSKFKAFRYAQNCVRNYSLTLPSTRFSTATLSRRPIRNAGKNYIRKPYAAPYHWAPFILIDDM